MRVFLPLKVDRLPAVGIFALRDVKDNEELTIDYGWTTKDKSKPTTLCKCGAKDCRTYMERVIYDGTSSDDDGGGTLDDDDGDNNNNDNNINLNTDDYPTGESTHDAANLLLLHQTSTKAVNTSVPSTTQQSEKVVETTEQSKNAQRAYNEQATQLQHHPTIVTDIPSTTAVDKSLLTFTQPSEKGQSTYAALLSLLFRDDDKIPSNNSDNECKEFLDVLRSSVKGQPVSWTMVMNSPLLKQVFSDGMNHCDSVSFLSFVICKFFPKHMLEFQYTSPIDKSIKKVSVNFLKLPTATTSDFKLSNATTAFEESINQLTDTIQDYDISFNGKYFVTMNNRELDNAFYTGNHWGSYALMIPNNITSERRFAVLCGFVVGTSTNSSHFTYLSYFDCNNVQKWKLISGKTFLSSAVADYSCS